ncbi:DUF3300 domain-containing protein [Shewanella amazonensis]|uniref:Lipoprotein n=1 Tax=Shewanella amazonensis (strain ATCC BAA-1098 / SB2B) TaxID=326297 RepID=A1SAV7_SHEAM|nr:DUF3300 domain-containing protein [Shewanella amazonensis]ABM01514.1 conserved hypothetical protein [Shewanella amazonensis SB2B]
MNRSIRIQLVSALMCLPLFSGCTSVAQAEPSEYSSSIRAERFSEAELARLLAPIALYPDTLLTHILIASSYPLEVVEAQRWREKNRKLGDKKLMDKAEKQGWDPSVTALIAFPNVLERMSDDLNWTRDLGDAFLADEEAVLDSIQMLRREADRAGNLDGGDNLVVKRQPTQIIIESPSPEIIYVPYYDPRVVYGHWRWNRYPPVYWAPFPGYVSYHRHFGWHSGISISFNFYFSNFHWYDRHVIVHHHHHYRRPPEPRYAISQGAQRWRHDPGHRHGVAYRSADVRQRFNVSTPSRIERDHRRHDEYSRVVSQQHNPQVRSRELSQSREQEFKARMNSSERRFENNGNSSRERDVGNSSRERDMGHQSHDRELRQQLNSRERADSRERMDNRERMESRERSQPQQRGFEQREPQRERQQFQERQRDAQPAQPREQQVQRERQREAQHDARQQRQQPREHQQPQRERPQPQRERHNDHPRERNL